MLPADVNATAPTPHVPLAQRLWLPLWLLTVLLIPASLYAIFVHAPVEARMGIAQKIFYFHVPAAYAMYVGFATAALGSVGYLLRRSLRFDAQQGFFLNDAPVKLLGTCNHHDHANATVEHPVHFSISHIALFLEPLE